MVFCNSDERLTILKKNCNLGNYNKDREEYTKANSELAFAEK